MWRMCDIFVYRYNEVHAGGRLRAGECVEQTPDFV